MSVFLCSLCARFWGDRIKAKRLLSNHCPWFLRAAAQGLGSGGGKTAFGLRHDELLRVKSQGMVGLWGTQYVDMLDFPGFLTG